MKVYPFGKYKKFIVDEHYNISAEKMKEIEHYIYCAERMKKIEQSRQNIKFYGLAVAAKIFVVCTFWFNFSANTLIALFLAGLLAGFSFGNFIKNSKINDILIMLIYVLMMVTGADRFFSFLGIFVMCEALMNDWEKDYLATLKGYPLFILRQRTEESDEEYQPTNYTEPEYRYKEMGSLTKDNIEEAEEPETYDTEQKTAGFRNDNTTREQILVNSLPKMTDLTGDSEEEDKGKIILLEDLPKLSSELGDGKRNIKYGKLPELDEITLAPDNKKIKKVSLEKTYTDDLRREK